MVERVTYLGFEVRVELALTGGGSVWAQVTRAEAEQLELDARPDRLGPPAPRARVRERRRPDDGRADAELGASAHLVGLPDLGVALHHLDDRRR